MLSSLGQYTIPLGTADGDDDDDVEMSSLHVVDSSPAAAAEHTSTGSGSGPAGGDDGLETDGMGGTIDVAAASIRCRAVMEQMSSNAHQ